MVLEHRLPCKITGCITTSSLYPDNRKIQFYVNHGRKSYLTDFSMLYFIYSTLKYLLLKKVQLKYDFTPDQFENGSNMIVSIIYKMVVDFVKDNKVLPPVLFINLDNCGRENKGSLLN